MEYTMMGKLNERVSRLGFGCMRFPTTPDGQIDEPRAEAMLRRAYEAGVNYFDTAYFYHNRTSEAFVGKVIKQFPRDSFNLATKLPLGIIETVEQAHEIYESQFKNLDVEYFDYYLLHAINGKKFDWVLENGIIDWLLEEQKKGRIRHLGFSFHDNYEAFERIITYRDWDFCQIQLNYMDWDNQNAKELYRLSVEYGVQLIIMEPVRGGSLVSLCDEAVSILKTAEPDRSVASWAIRFAASLPNVLCVLSGMSNMEQVEDNCATMTDFKALTEEDHATLAGAIAAYNRAGTIPCTACRYCFECPKGIQIPEIFAVYNNAAAENRLPLTVGHTEEEFAACKAAFIAEYDAIPAEAQAHNCVNCGKCKEVCPQSIDIPRKLREIAGMVDRIR